LRSQADRRRSRRAGVIERRNANDRIPSPDLLEPDPRIVIA
jgi:hypothetical protein